MAEFEKLLKTVFYYPDAHSMAMATGGKERLRIDANGRFRFGTRGTPVNETVRIAGETDDATKLALNVTNASGTSLFAARNDGWINYGQLAKLEVADNFTATIRAADLLLGHSSRRGSLGFSPGRALVDLTRELHLNYAADWPDGIRYYGALLSACTRELKENIEEFSSEEAAAILESLNPVKFSLKADDRKAPHLGFIAEDSPDLVTSADKKAVNHDHIIAVLTKMVKEQGKAIVSLTESVTLLETAFRKFVEDVAQQPTLRPRQDTSSRKGSKPTTPGRRCAPSPSAAVPVPVPQAFRRGGASPEKIGQD